MNKLEAAHFDLIDDKLTTEVDPEVLFSVCTSYNLDLAINIDVEDESSVLWWMTFNPNLPNPLNFVPFGMMGYSLFDIYIFLNIYEHNLHMIALSFNLHKCDWIQIDNFNTENPQNRVAKLGLRL